MKDIIAMKRVGRIIAGAFLCGMARGEDEDAHGEWLDMAEGSFQEKTQKLAMAESSSQENTEQQTKTRKDEEDDHRETSSYSGTRPVIPYYLLLIL